MKKCSQIYLKLLILGSNVRPGKTQLILRYCNNKYEENFLSTISHYFENKHVDVNGHVIKVQIWDSPGVDRFREVTRSFFMNTNAFMIVFDVKYLSSLKEACSWYDDIREFNLQDKVAVALVGNKIDINEERQVSYEEAKKIAEQYGWLYFETSAKKGTGVDEAFVGLIEEALKYY